MQGLLHSHESEETRQEDSFSAFKNVDDGSTGFSALVVVLLLRLRPCDGVAAGENEQQLQHGVENADAGVGEIAVPPFDVVAVASVAAIVVAAIVVAIAAAVAYVVQCFVPFSVLP